MKAHACACSAVQAGGNADELQEKSKELKKKIAEVEEKEKDVIKQRDATVVLIGNIVHDSVPVDDDEVRPIADGSFFGFILYWF